MINTRCPFDKDLACAECRLCIADEGCIFLQLKHLQNIQEDLPKIVHNTLAIKEALQEN